MICRKVPISISPTPQELAYEIWHMRCDEQAVSEIQINVKPRYGLKVKKVR